MKFRIDLPFQLNNQTPKWLVRSQWDHINTPVYQRSLDFMLSKIRMPFHLLSTNRKGNNFDLDFSLAEIVHSLKFLLLPRYLVQSFVLGPERKDGVKMWSCNKLNSVISFVLEFGLTVIAP